ncbi:Cation/H(+) antiporter 15 [Rhynchospora pubera]|uniref:Cation/H(+) antiporter 15 n=2 Tax=Rhynchospora pubera TaxID=906938 RepID=A0AAV8EMC4_9POAL|nr:Cation/H(+) antiporter 15 [Rhynchospora pubera]KAJ4786858.1 Cation/H(+) antiporter 15 [Rhynchospora pubera]KAJ4807517.1 Cation/H(+) antiporter 15 [Rhynchospora pubera]
MSLKNSSGYDPAAVKPFTEACYDNNLVNSQGIFLGDIPIRFALPLLLLELSIIFIFCSIADFLLKRIGVPRVVTQLLVGIVLGPSVLGQSRQFRILMFPERGMYLLENISLIALILFLFSISARTDLGLLRRPARSAVAVGFASSVLPLALALILFYTMRNSFPVDLQHTTLVAELAVRLSLSSFPVVTDALGELNLLSSDLGRIAVSASLVSDVCSWVMKVLFFAGILFARANSPAAALEIVALFVAFVIVLFVVLRPTVIWISQKKTPPGELIGEGYFVGLMIIALLSALTTEVLGFKYMLGPVMLGLALPGGMPLGRTLTEHLDSFFTSIFLPVYVVLAGYRTDFKELNRASRWTLLELITFVCFVGKLIGSLAAGVFYKLSVRDAFCLGLMLNIKGVIEISFINNWGDSQKATAQHFSVLILSMMIITTVTTPLIKYLYNPSARIVATKRRTIEHAKRNSAFRMLVCLHTEEHVAPVLDLLEAISPSPTSPITLNVLHLSDLSGDTSSFLRMYRRPRDRGTFNAADRIVNAFRYFEQNKNYELGSLSIQPFVSSCPYNTMHNDICSLALRCKSRLIVLPFHKQSDGARETSKQSFQMVNRMVMDIAPCSVAILVDRSIPAGSTYAHPTSLFQHIGVYFLGGPDDRDALSIGSRMSLIRNTHLTVVRILLSSEEDINKRDPQDERFMAGIKKQHASNERAVFEDKFVDDGEGTSAIVSSTSEKYDLVIVGRRKRQEQSPLTSGLAEWSECTELGVLGDMLATLDGEQVSIMVVQQHVWLSHDETAVEVPENVAGDGTDARTIGDGSNDHLLPRI